MTTTETTGSAFTLPIPATAPHPTAPLVQSLMLPAGVTSGHWYTAGLNSLGRPVGLGETRVDLFVTGEGHWGLNTDPCGPNYEAGCRGCGDVESSRCPKRPTAQDIASALLASWPRSKPHSPRGFYRQLRREALEGCAA